MNNKLLLSLLALPYALTATPHLHRIERHEGTITRAIDQAEIVRAATRAGTPNLTQLAADLGTLIENLKAVAADLATLKTNAETLSTNATALGRQATTVSTQASTVSTSSSAIATTVDALIGAQ